MDTPATEQPMNISVLPGMAAGSNHLKSYGNRVTDLTEHQEITIHQAGIVPIQGRNHWNIRAVSSNKQDHVLVDWEVVTGTLCVLLLRYAHTVLS